MFRFTQEPSSGSYNQCLAKITSLVQKCVSVQTFSELWRHIIDARCNHEEGNLYLDWTWMLLNGLFFRGFQILRVLCLLNICIFEHFS